MRTRRRCLARGTKECATRPSPPTWTSPGWSPKTRGMIRECHREDEDEDDDDDDDEDDDEDDEDSAWMAQISA
jgi:hypothetical protein